MQDAFMKLQRIVVMKLKRVSQLTLGLFFADAEKQGGAAMSIQPQYPAS